MLSEVQEKSSTTPTDTAQVAVAPQAAVSPTKTQTTTATTVKVVSTVPRKTFEQQEPAIFGIWIVAIAYVAILILRRTVKMKKAHH